MDFKKHIALTSCQEVSQICSDYFRSFGGNYFNYTRIYSDKTAFFLTSDAAWVDYFFSHNYHAYNTICGKETHEFGNSRFLWGKFLGGELYTTASERFNIDNGFAIVQKMKNYHDFFIFGAPKYNYAINNFYLNNVDVLELFSLLFKNSASQLIHEAEKNKISLVEKIPSEALPSIDLAFTSVDSFLNQRYTQKILNGKIIKKWPIYLNGHEVFLSHRELLCLAYLLQGNSFKSIALLMNISPRTVETYLKYIKRKLNYHTKAEMISGLQNSQIERLSHLFGSKSLNNLKNEEE